MHGSVFKKFSEYIRNNKRLKTDKVLKHTTNILQQEGTTQHMLNYSRKRQKIKR
jgi:hypothetical protein